jgi:formate-dependent nitrite reductase membrane component NrfD
MSMSNPPTSKPTPGTYAVWAIVVMVLGWLIAIATGLCGGMFVISGILDNTGYSEAVIMAGLILGGIPCLLGVGMILAARKWGKRRNPPANPDVFT